MGERQQEKLLALFEKCKDSGDLVEGKIEDINYFNLMSRAGTSGKLETWGDMHVCAYKYDFLRKPSILMIISIPINSAKESCTSKNIAERIMEIVKDSELCFTTLDFNTSTEIKKEKFIYITLVKVIEEE